MSTLNTDILIIGSGVAGTTVARSLLNKGAKDVLMLEAGGTVPMAENRRWEDYASKKLDEDDTRPYSGCRDEVSPNPSFENVGAWDAQTEGFRRHEWNLRGSRLLIRGGTMLHWGGWAFRLRPEDFQLKSNTGHLIDWQFGYDEMEPFYSQAERLFQVAGKEKDSNQPPRLTGRYPFKKLPYALTDKPLIDFFENKGIGYGPLPISRNTIRNTGVKLGLDDDPEPVESVTPCFATGTCKYCPFKAKFTNDQSLDYVIEKHSNKFRLKTRSPVKKLLFKGNKSTGAIAIDATTGKEFVIRAKHVIIASGAIEAPKLLQASGIQNDHLGMHLSSHPLFIVRGKKIHDEIAPQQEIHYPTLCSRHFDSERYQKQGKLLLAKYYTRPNLDIAKLIAQGKSAAEIDKEAHTEHYEIRGFIENVTGAHTRVSLANGSTSWGLPRTKLEISGETYPEKAIQHYLKWMETSLRDDMGYDIHTIRSYPPRGDHAMSTCRMASSAREGVVDQELRVFGTDNVYVVSNAVYPNGGVVNPTLTLGALALKFAAEFHANNG